MDHLFFYRVKIGFSRKRNCTPMLMILTFLYTSPGIKTTFTLPPSINILNRVQQVTDFLLKKSNILWIIFFFHVHKNDVIFTFMWRHTIFKRISITFKKGISYDTISSKIVIFDLLIIIWIRFLWNEFTNWYEDTFHRGQHFLKVLPINFNLSTKGGSRDEDSNTMEIYLSL